MALAPQKPAISCSRRPLDGLTNAVSILTPFKRTSVLVRTKGEGEGLISRSQPRYSSPIVLQRGDD